MTAEHTLYKELPPEMNAAADWKVKLKNGTTLPCHSLCLAAVSPVLAVALATSTKESCIPLPDYMDLESLYILLRWVYHLQYTLNIKAAYNLALLSHEWDMKSKLFLSAHKRRDRWILFAWRWLCAPASTNTLHVTVSLLPFSEHWRTFSTRKLLDSRHI